MSSNQWVRTGWTGKVSLRRLKRASIAFLAATGLSIVGLRPLGAAVQDTNSVLGFESVSDWNAPGGAITGVSPLHTQGTTSLAVHASGYTVLTSRLIGPLGQVFHSFSLDLGMPAGPAAGWAGAAQLFVSIPSLGVNNSYIGQVDLNGLKTGQFNHLNFSVPDALVAKMSAAYSDLSFAIVLNVPTNSQSVYLLDNLEVSSTIPPNSTVGLQDRGDILGFEVATPAWAITSGTILGQSASPAGRQGTFALAFKPHGYSTLTSPPLPSLGPISNSISFDLWQPTSAPGTYGAAQLFVSVPSRGVYNAYLGQVDLNSVPPATFKTLSFGVPTTLIGQLNSQYTDLRFTVALNVPVNQTSAYYIDRFQVGSVTSPPALLPGIAVVHPDLVGVSTSGLASLTSNGSTISTTVTRSTFYVEEGDKTCVPTASQACRYTVHLMRFLTGPVSAFGMTNTKATLFNLVPFEVVLGGNGSGSLSSKIPAHIPFSLTAEGHGFAWDFFPGSAASITISPSGNGLIAASAQFQGSVDGNAIAVNVAVTANSPLANRPPVAVAGPDQSITGSYCVASVQLDGSSSTDPDGNLTTFEWFDGDTFVGKGSRPKITVRKPGLHVITLAATDAFGATSRDQVNVTAQIPVVCGFINPD